MRRINSCNWLRYDVCDFNVQQSSSEQNLLKGGKFIKQRKVFLQRAMCCNTPAKPAGKGCRGKEHFQTSTGIDEKNTKEVMFHVSHKMHVSDPNRIRMTVVI